MNLILTLTIIALIALAAWPSESKAEIDWEGIVVHHSGTEGGTIESFDKYHKQIGFDEIGYHFVIYKDGSIHEGRPLNKVGAHASGRNKTHIGICLVGNNSFTRTQLSSLHILIWDLYLYRDYPIKTIERHHELCPGDSITLPTIEEK